MDLRAKSSEPAVSVEIVWSETELVEPSLVARPARRGLAMESLEDRLAFSAFLPDEARDAVLTEPCVNNAGDEVGRGEVVGDG